MAWITPKAADFKADVNGEPLAWNNEFGLRVRWKAARLAKSFRRDDLVEAATLATQQVRDELNDNTITIEVA